MTRRFGLYALLALIVASAGAYQCRESYLLVRSMMEWERTPRRPFERASSTTVVARVLEEARRAGLAPGDRIESIDGVPLVNDSVEDAALWRSAAGDQLEATLNDGRSVSITLAPTLSQAPGGLDWTLMLVLQVLMPWVCLVLAFWVAAMRPRDPLAWLLLCLLVSFSLISRIREPLLPGGLARDLLVCYRTLGGETWAIWMLLLGVYFPERLAQDRRWPWAKWLLILPIAAHATTLAVFDVARGHSFVVARPLAELLGPVRRPIVILSMLAISLFFVGLGIKTGTTTGRDAKRRLQLLHTGATISLTPMFVVVLTALVRGVNPFTETPRWILLLALMSLFLFPLTLAYVIVVHRALDVRVVIRQGLRHAFARRGVHVLRVLLILGILFAVSAAASRPNTRQVEIMRALGLGLLAIVAIGRVADGLLRWTDRRFFREALDAEQILTDLSEKVRTIVETRPLLETVVGRLSESLHVPQVACLLDVAGSYEPAFAVGYGQMPTACFRGDGVAAERLRRDRAPVRVYLEDPRSWLNARGRQDDADRQALRDLGAQLLLPLVVGEKLPGFICLGAKRSEEPYSGTDLRLLQSVATQTGLALENSRLAAAIATEVAHRERLNREVEIAREVQERLFPQRLPVVEGLDFSGSCRPALGVGGDYFDFLQLPDGRLGVAIADVSGKGIGAALLMASLQASLRGQTIEGSADLSRLFHNVNRLVYEASPENRYATFFYGQYDPATRVLSYVNAGHCPPIVLRPAGAPRGGPEAVQLKTGGTVIGLFSDSSYKGGSVVLAPGDLLVAYTDGISEALNPRDEEWGEQRLLQAAAACDGLNARDTIVRLMQEADAFVDGAEQHDDMTLVVIRVTASGPAVP